jgi:hypothetical protein
VRRSLTLSLAVVAASAVVASAAAAAAPRDGGDEQPAQRTMPRPPALASATGIAAAERYAASRAGTVAFAVLGEDGALRGLNRTATFPSASVVKAMLLVALLRHDGSGPVPAGQKALLKPMITVSDNDAAEAVYALVGAGGLRAVAKVAGMHRFAVSYNLFDAQLTAADQAHFFLHIDKLVPAAHRAYARALLAGIVPGQRWGIAPVASARGFKVFFKGGWRTGIVHQVALLERGGHRVALAILTSGEPSMDYGEATLTGIASRVLTKR